MDRELWLSPTVILFPFVCRFTCSGGEVRSQAPSRQPATIKHTMEKQPQVTAGNRREWWRIHSRSVVNRFGSNTLTRIFLKID